MNRRLRGGLLGLAVGPVVCLWVAVLAPAPAQAHPLGNFTVNHYDALTLEPGRIDVLSVVDRAEIPTQQEIPSIDTDGDGTLSAAELTARAENECPQVQAATELAVDGVPLVLTAAESMMIVVPGAAALPTLRLECRLSARADLTDEATVDFTQGFGEDRIGWREITVSGDGVSLLDPPVPSSSVSDELREYPEDLLASPLDVRSVTLAVVPGSSTDSGDATDGGIDLLGNGRDPVSRLVAVGDEQLQAYLGARELTPLVGVVAVVLSGLLGAGHAMLPGHGKAVMAAYLAGRRGRRRDALVVGATVTLTHTVGVLVLGLVLTAASSIAGEGVLRYLGLISGLVIVVVGVVLVRDAWRGRAVSSSVTEIAVPALAGTGSSGATALTQDGGHGHEHGHGHGPQDGHGHDPQDGQGHGHGHSHAPADGMGRRSLIGIGVAGGLVPSPSALVVLLGAIALGRTVFGVLLVLAYGLGMAATLTAVGLLLVAGVARLERVEGAGRRARTVVGLRAWLPLVTATLVLVVGLGIIARGLLA